MKNFFLLVGLWAYGVVQAQFIRGPIGSEMALKSGVKDGVYFKEAIPTKKLVQYEPVRESDVVWSKRVWSAIDLRQKINHPLYYPMDDIQENIWNRNPSVWSMWTIIRQHILNGDLTIYSPFHPQWESWTDGDSFKYPIISSQAGGNYYNDSIFRQDVFMYLGTELIDPFAEPCQSVLFPGEDSTIEQPNGTFKTIYPPNDTAWFLSSDIVQYRIKEDWFFDKERSTLDRRIIGIAPVVYQRDANGNISGLRELFWLYFPECRYVFQNYFVSNRHNDAQLMSLDDLFWKRMFHSYILKESNVYNREVSAYQAGVDALLESNRIKEKVSNFEHDLWGY